MLGCMLQHDVLNTCFFILLFFCAVLKRMKEIVVLLESQEFIKQFYNILQFFLCFQIFPCHWDERQKSPNYIWLPVSRFHRHAEIGRAFHWPFVFASNSLYQDVPSVSSLQNLLNKKTLNYIIISGCSICVFLAGRHQARIPLAAQRPENALQVGSRKSFSNREQSMFYS